MYLPGFVAGTFFLGGSGLAEGADESSFLFILPGTHKPIHCHNQNLQKPSVDRLKSANLNRNHSQGRFSGKDHLILLPGKLLQ